jgi:citrate synthase
MTTTTSKSPEATVSATADTLTIIDNRTGKQYEIPIRQCAIKATDLRQITAGPEDTGLMTYDPAFLNTA